MYSVIILLPITLIAAEIYFEDFGKPDNESPVFNPKDIRENFLRNRRTNSENTKKIMQLDKILPNTTIYVDNIPHYAKKNYSKANSIETEFRNLIAMNGLTYKYKRDTFWRTWRKVSFSGKINIIMYRCENTVNFTHCHNGGYWVIEDKPPPCPYELFSMLKGDRLCAVHVNQYYNNTKNCKSVINLSEFTESCSNPVVTQWRVEKTFGHKAAERFPNVICGGREICAITTMYKISTDHISFRIVNESNDVIYSRIMKQGKNYACVDECGKMDPYTYKIAMATKGPLVVNLLGKKKREYKPFASSKNKKESKQNIIIKFQTNNLLVEGARRSLVKDEFDDDWSLNHVVSRKHRGMYHHTHF